MERHRVAIVIPALNEAVTIARVIAGSVSKGIPIVVDDHSSDDTAEVARAAGATVVRLEKTEGYDGALDRGFKCAAELGCEYVITIDADGQHDPDLIAAFVSALDDGADLVVGIRDRRQRFGEYVFSAVGRVRWGISDPLCGIKGYRIGLYNDLGHFDSYSSIGTELAAYAAHRGKRIVQVPLTTCARADRPRFGNGFVANRRILRSLWLGLRRF